MTDPVAVLAQAFTDWEHAAAHPPRYPTALWLADQAAAKEEAIRALGLHGSRTHEAIAAARRLHIAGQPGGMDIPSACQTFVNDSLEEAS